ncbi:UNVERIFIED_CONTAM: hypothetical protein GTU68_038684 [Idotea baltica]|nr:hypothetical protein [Idotea baltica]
MHGLGADATDFEPLVPMLDLAAPLRFVFPNAPERAVTVNGGMVMRAWYDIDTNSPMAGDKDIQESAGQVADLIQREIDQGCPADRIVLAGFSQGGVIALQQGLRHMDALAGIMALSTYVHNPDNLVEEISFTNADIPIFMAHGMSDAAIPIARAVSSRQALEQLNYQVQWHQYAMGHQVCPEEIADIAAWLNQVYAGKS